jgi:hypothetical protein
MIAFGQENGATKGACRTESHPARKRRPRLRPYHSEKRPTVEDSQQWKPVICQDRLGTSEFKLATHRGVLSRTGLCSIDRRDRRFACSCIHSLRVMVMPRSSPELILAKRGMDLSFTNALDLIT